MMYTLWLLRSRVFVADEAVCKTLVTKEDNAGGVPLGQVDACPIDAQADILSGSIVKLHNYNLTPPQSLPGAGTRHCTAEMWCIDTRASRPHSICTEAT